LALTCQTTSPDGDLIWRLSTFVGYGIGFTQWIEDIDAR
jgi:hypothetical protein